MTWYRDKLLLCSAALIVVVCGVGLLGARSWVGKAFPGFLVLDNRVVASAGLSRWPAVEDAEIYQQEVVAVGGLPIESASDLWEHVRSAPVGSELVYRFEGNGESFERTIATRLFDRTDFGLLFGAYLLNGLAMFAAAFGIRFLRGRHPLASATGPLLLISAVWGLTAMDLYGPYRMFRLHVLCESMLFPAFLAMALGFPQKARIVERRPWLRWAPYALAAPLAIVYQLGLYDAGLYVACHRFANLAIGAAVGLLIASQVARFVRLPSFEARQRIKVLAMGTAVALTPPLVLTLGSALTGGKASQNAIAFSAFLYPLAIGYAVIRHNLLDVDILVRRSLGYVVLTSVVMGFYSVSVAVLDIVVQNSGVARSAYFDAGFAALSITVLLPLRDRVQSTVDRIFFRSAYDFRRTIEITSARMAAVTELQVISEELSDAAESTLHPQSIVLYTRRSKQEPLKETARSGETPALAETLAVELGSLEFADVASGPFDRDDGGLVVPFRTEGTLVGVLQLGPRSSGKTYGGEDRRLLQILANQGAVAIRNALTLEQVRELNRSLESKVEDRTKELREKNEMLRHLSSTDMVTGLRSRRFTIDVLTREFERTRRHNGKLGIMMMDLDHFKRVNDTYGHLAGDEVLRQVSDVVKTGLRVSDVAGRYGGEELLLVLPDADPESSTEAAERLRQMVEARAIELDDGRIVEVTTSIGLAFYHAGVASPEALIAAADEALYRAKDDGRNRVVVAG